MAQEFSKRLYLSKEWISLRNKLIVERGPKCEKCGKLVADTSKLIAHHKTRLTPQNINNVNVTLNPDNIDLYCFDCHNREPGHFLWRNTRNVYLVYGPPCSGKKTLVHQMAERGDIILDIDKLYEAISGMPLYDKPDNLRFNVFALRDKMIDMIKTRYGQWHDAFVIGGYPNKAERERLARELGAELIFCEVSRDECRLRAIERGGDWPKFVDKWFEEYVA